MRMLYITGCSLALTWGLNLIDPPAASAVSSPSAVQATGRLVLSVPRGGSHRADSLAARKPWR